MRVVRPSRLCNKLGDPVKSIRHASKSTFVPTNGNLPAENKAREDHRAVATSQGLYSLHASSPGSPLFQPKGTHILQKLQTFLRAQYPLFGIQEVLTPTIYKKSLWETSGHWRNYKDDMFAVTGRGAQGGHDLEREIGEEEEYGLKPMNCPGHCLLFKSQRWSYKDLPVRYADFSPLHRNELSGSLSGLTRLRRFHQDDGHIFCTPSQIKEEILRTLEFIQMVYEQFDLGEYRLRLGTRPEQFVGTVEDWEGAEEQLKMALKDTGRSYDINPQDGAFYGPKIDIIIKDSDGRDHQTATIQLDFQLPKRFGLEYSISGSKENPIAINNGLNLDKMDTWKHTPVLIHRAILGSLERFMALLIEKYDGKWPFWLSPRQFVILTVGNNADIRQEANTIARQLSEPDRQAGAQSLQAQHYLVDCDHSDRSISKKVLDARKKGYVFYGVVGERNVKGSAGETTVDVTLCNHPNEKDVLMVLENVLRQGTNSSLQINDNLSSSSITASNRLTVAQCKDIMKGLSNRYK